MELIYILVSIFLVSLVSLIGIFTFSIKTKLLKKYLIYLIAISAGILMGNSFFHLIPESIELYEENEKHLEIGVNHLDKEHEAHEKNEAHKEHSHGEIFLPSIFILIGILFFYLLERFIFWHHHHDLDCKKHTISKLVIIGDGFHNFIDGLLIAGAFLIDVRIGILTTIGIIIHEIPQEIGDFFLLIHSGFSKKKALLFNFLSSLIAFLGGIVGYFVLQNNLTFLPLFVAFIAGNFIYLALVDILPELHKKNEKKYVEFFFLLGIVIIGLFIFL